MNFFKSGSQKNSNRDISKPLKDHFLRKPYKLEVLNLVVMFLWWVSTNWSQFLFEKTFFSICMAENGP